MARRRKAVGSIDSKIFKRTALKTKKINVDPAPMRGGIRLWHHSKYLISSLKLFKSLKVYTLP